MLQPVPEAQGLLAQSPDELSHRYLVDHEWRLHPEVVQDLFREWGEPWFDLFTTNKNVQCQHFCVLEFPRRLSQGDAFRLE